MIAVVRVTECAELIVIDVFNAADKTGEQITLGMVETRLAELLAHKPGCRCGRCEAAAKVRAAHVYRIASAWQGAIAVTNGRAVR